MDECLRDGIVGFWVCESMIGYGCVPEGPGERSEGHSSRAGEVVILSTPWPCFSMPAIYHDALHTSTERSQGL